MNFYESVLKSEEKAIFALRSLYRKHGYSPYKMSKFEEYDLYVQNKDFLVSDNIITFTDTDGKLMALKPDVTLSIIKNGEDTPDHIQKVYYNENVYRISPGSGSYKEIMQVGLECIGAIDECCMFEVLALAAESLSLISPDFVLDISHMGVVSDRMESLGISGASAKKLLACIGEKNTHDMDEILTEEGVSQEGADQLKKLVTTYGSIDAVLPFLESMDSPSAKQFARLAKALAKTPFADRIRIDFSVINNMSYYNGIVFQGFMSGIPGSILSGGQYDKLMQKMHRKSAAIGFAVYLDMLERMTDSAPEYDVDVLLLYDADANPLALFEAMETFHKDGKTVLAEKCVPEGLQYKEAFRLTVKGVEKDG